MSPPMLLFGANDTKQLGCVESCGESGDEQMDVEDDRGDMILVPSPPPFEVIARKRISSIALGLSHSAWLDTEGQVYTMGLNDCGQCGVSAPEVVKSPVRLDALSMHSILQVSAGGSHTLAVADEGTLFSWGANDFGQSAHGVEMLEVRKPKMVRSAFPMASGAKESAPLSNAYAPVLAASVSAGDHHTLILDQQAQLHACGQGKFGALGLGDLADKHAPTLVLPLTAMPLRAAGAGERHSVALAFSGAVFLWGWRSEAELAMPGASRVVASPRVVPRLSGGDAVQIAVGGGHVLVRLRDGSVVAWGRGAAGELGGGTVAAAATPKRAELPAGAVDIAAGREHSLALLSDGRVVGWGSARCGQLGLGDTVDKTIPTELALTPDVRGSVKFVCAGGHSSALLLDEAAGSVAARAVDVISLDLVRELCDSEDYSRLAQLVGAVFGSPALFNASFAPAGKLQSQDLEAVYVLLLQSYDKAPAVLTALRSSMRQLLDVLTLVASANPDSLLPSHNQGGSSTANASSSLEPPSPARSLSGALFTSSRHPSAAASNEPFVLKPIIGLLCNPLLGHAAEATHLYRAAAIVDNLPSEHRARFTKMLQELPADILVARCVRPMREALDRVFKLLFAGGSSDHAAAIQLVRLLGTLRDANEDKRKSGGGISPSEFYSPYLSERLGVEELRRDYFIWAAHGPSDRGSPPQVNFSFCSEPWLFSPLAKSKLLQLLFPPKRKHFGSREVACDARKAATSPFFVLTVRRDHLVDDTLDALACSVIGNLFKPLRVVFEGEPAIDEGGVRKEFFQLLCEALFDPTFGMFAWNAEARTFWFATTSYEAEAEFFLVGLVIGLAIHNGVILDLHFPPLLYRRLMNEPVVFDDLREVQPDLHRGLCSLRQFEGDVESTFMADHTVVLNNFGEAVVHELIPDGANVPVTNENREEYLRLYVDYLLVAGVRVQAAPPTRFDAFQRGFLKLCDGPAFSFLTSLELEELTCGTPVLDFKALQSATKYDGYTPDSQVVRWFWEVVFAFELDEKKALLFFATGCDRAPVGGLGKLKLVLQRAGDDSMNLPHAHTCFNLLSIPEYRSRGKLRDRLTIAIHNSQGFGMQ